jgi:sugar phosphate isomerase/epimerase
MPARERFGFNAAATRPVEDSIRWAHENGFRRLDFNADDGPNGLSTFDWARIDGVKGLCRETGVRISIHTRSAVNNAELSPHVSEAVDEYNRANIELARRLDCEAVIVHGGYHFGDVPRRREAAVARIKRLVGVAAAQHVPLWLENHNMEPVRAEIHYMPFTVEELRWFLEAPGLSDGAGREWLKWSFNAGHANLVPEKIAGFLDTFGVERIAQVRITDNTGEYEVHMVPGQGNIDFPDLFRRLDTLSYQGPFSLDFGNDEDKVRVLDGWVSL